MTSDDAVPFAVKRAAGKMHKNRATLYANLANRLNASKGSTKFSKIFEKNIEREPDRPVGQLSQYWLTKYLQNGGDLAETFQGTLPDDEVSIIRVAQSAGADALPTSLEDIAKIAALTDRIRKESFAIMLAAIVGVTISIVMVTAFPVFSSMKLREIYSFIPLEQWGPQGKSFTKHAQNVLDYSVYALFMLAAFLYAVTWSFTNLTGKTRDWLDTHVSIYKTLRDIKGAMFLATMATLTRRRGNTMYTVKDSIDTLMRASRSRWMKWRLGEISENIEHSGATGSEVFHTNMLSHDMYFFLLDAQEARGFSEGFEETGKYVQNTMMDSIVARMTVYRWILLLSGVILVVVMISWQMSVIYEMKGVMMNYYSSK